MSVPDSLIRYGAFYYDLIPNLFTFQALYGDLVVFSVERKQTKTLWVIQRGAVNERET